MEAKTHRRTQAIAIAVLAAIGVVIAIVVSQGGSESDPSGGGADPLELIADLDQEGLTVGEPDAPLTLTEYGDLQCPFCADAARDLIPTVLEDYVASGDLRIDFKPLAFLGPDSETAAEVAVAAGEQDRGFAFVSAFYEDQGAENSGYVTEDFLRSVAAQVEGLDIDEALSAAAEPATGRALQNVAADATEANVDSTPTFLLGPTGEEGEIVEVSPSDTQAFLEVIESALSR